MNKKNIIVLSATAVVALIIGVGIGGSSSSEPGATVTAEAKPAVTVTAEATPVETVPQACLDALDDAEGLFNVTIAISDLASESIALIPEAAAAGMDYDAATLDRIASDLDGISSRIADQTAIVTASTYAANRDACQAAG